MAKIPAHVDRDFRRFYLLGAHHRHARTGRMFSELLAARSDAGENTEDQYVWQHKNG